jgi:periplasmic protein TonB
MERRPEASAAVIPMTNPHPSQAGKTDNDSPLGHFCGATRMEEPRLKAFGSNLREFLSARPGKVRADGETPFFSDAGFGTGVKENWKEFWKASPQGKDAPGLLTESKAEFGGFWQNLREFVAPAKGPRVAPGEAVPELWSKDTQLTRVRALSIAGHLAVLALILAPLLTSVSVPANSKPNESATAIDLSKYDLRMLPKPKPDGGGGSSHDHGPSTRGKAPKVAKVQFAAPTSHPVLNGMTPTVAGDPKIQAPDLDALTWGNPLTNVIGNSMGDNGGSGIGDGPGGDGLGDGGISGVGHDGHPAGYGGYGRPECLYCPNAQFSDEAVKAKYQGVVMVNALITPDGRATDIQVIKSLGLGLDENAVAAVKTWRFKPARGPDGKPAAVEQTIEVEFRLI